MHRLRKRLKEYYAAVDPKVEPVRITSPEKSYIPDFQIVRPVATDAVAIVDGSGLFDQLNSSWSDYADESISEEAWQELVQKVAKFDKMLGAGLAERIREENDPQPLQPTAADL